jgi:hypothetical protein
LTERLGEVRRMAAGASLQADSVCAICLDGLRAQQVVIELRCGHEYHKPCILKWLKSCDPPTCPQCKTPALSDGKEEPRAAPAAREREASPEQQWWHT